MAKEHRRKNIFIEGVSVRPEMPDAVVVWLDTNVLLGFTRMRSGEYVDESLASRLGPLHAQLLHLAGSGKVVVVAGEQDEEVIRGQPRFQATIRELAGCAAFEHQAAINDAETYALMKAWALASGEASLRISQVFNREARRGPRRTTGWLPQDGLAALSARAQATRDLRRGTASKMEVIRSEVQQARARYPEWLKEEQRGVLRAHVRLTEMGLGDLRRGEMNLATMLRLQALGRLQHFLEEIMEEVGRLPGDLTDFFNSPYATAIPSNRVTTSLYAWSMCTSNKPPSSSFIGDVENLKIALPYADVIVTDVERESEIVDRLSLASEMSTQVFSMKSVAELTAWLTTL